MLQICRAEDGEITQVNATVRDIERIGSLELFLHQETGVDEDAILAYLSDGRRLKNDNVRELAGASDQSIFVFNKYYLDFDLGEVLHELRVEPLLQPPIEDTVDATPPIRPSFLAASYLRVAHAHFEYITRMHSTLPHQHQAVRIACGSLDLNVLTISDVFETFSVGAVKELDKQASLLAGLDADLEIISRVRVHVQFLSTSARKAIESGERTRTLGDYVSVDKMRTVADSCAWTHADLQKRFTETQAAVSKLVAETDAIRAVVSDIRLLEEADLCLRRSQELFNNITDRASQLDTPVADPDGFLQELKHFDIALRNEVQSIAGIKNAYIEQCIGALRRISLLNSDMVQLPVSLSFLQTAFRNKNSFIHIQRLHNMLYTYGATVIEIVRRKEFARFFYQRAQSILEVMAKLSASERKRRQVYRSEVHGQLPFETRGMDEPVPTIDFSPTGNPDSHYSLEREDIDALFQVLGDLERYGRANNNAVALAGIHDCRLGLEKLVQKMDSLESGFDRIAERSLLSASRLSWSRRRTVEADEQALARLSEQLREAQQQKADQEALFAEERSRYQTELSCVQSKVQEAETIAAGERTRADGLEKDLHYARAQIENEITSRRIIEERQTEVSSEVGRHQEALAAALAEATNSTREAEIARQELEQVRAEFEAVKTLETQSAAKIASLLEDQAVTLKNLDEARARGEDLSAQIQSARAESEDVHRTLKDAAREKETLLRAQASEHERLMRDHIAEADGDRAVLEHQLSEARAELEVLERQVKDARSQTEVANADAIGLREELQRVEHDLRDIRHAERILRDDLKVGRASQSDYEQRLESSFRLIAQILDVAIGFRDTHLKALATARSIISHASSLSKSTINAAEIVTSAGIRQSMIIPPEDPSPIDPSDPTTALETLRAFDHDNFLETIAKTGSTIRKWQKQCKEYRERAKGKISFRNFSKGDLALFLPTRNSVSKPWAAFNVSFPHYFLQATGHLAEQLQTREWIVARITSITERVVDHTDPTSNPYGLGDGVKYYMLEVEDWTQQTQTNKRRVSAKKVNADQMEKQPPPRSASPISPLPPGPPEDEVEEAFRVTRQPTSHFFPNRPRSDSSPNPGPSSLSRLLAQAPTENGQEVVIVPGSRSPSPSPTPFLPPSTSSSQPPPSSSQVPPSSSQVHPSSSQVPSPPAQVSLSPSQPPPSPLQGSADPSSVRQSPALPSPLRPGSRASRASMSSKFSGGRIPARVVASATVSKPAVTTALSEGVLTSSPPTSSSNSPAHVSTPLPGAILEDMSSLGSRRRTTSYHIPRASFSGTSSAAPSPTVGNGATASSTLANLASSWGVSFGRRKKTDQPVTTTAAAGSLSSGEND